MRKEIVLCQHCGNRTSHTILCEGVETEELVEVENPSNTMDLTISIWFSKCDTCGNHSVYNSINNTAGDAYSVYPPEKPVSDKIPRSIAKAYKEALKIKKQSNYAFIILIRRALELVCIKENATGRSLADKIKNLGSKGILPSKLTDMADVIRLLGNSGAHSDELNVNEYELTILDEFFMAIVDYIYCVHHNVELLKQKVKRDK